MHASVILPSIVLTCGALALLFMLRAFNRARYRRPVACTLHTVVAALWLAIAAAVALIGVDLASYARLTYEAPVAEVRFRQAGERQFGAELLLPDGARESFVLRGDEWQLDARVLKWHGAATLMGVDTAFRLDRIGGRYRNIDEECRCVESRAALPRLAALARCLVRQRNVSADGRRRPLRRQHLLQRTGGSTAQSRRARSRRRLALTAAHAAAWLLRMRERAPSPVRGAP